VLWAIGVRVDPSLDSAEVCAVVGIAAAMAKVSVKVNKREACFFVICNPLFQVNSETVVEATNLDLESQGGWVFEGNATDTILTTDCSPNRVAYIGSVSVLARRSFDYIGQ
jgi:hypothetical protein